MAFFGVTREKIEKVWNHPNADRLSLAKCVGLSFQFVIGKDQFKAGDEVLYFPIDSLLPPILIEAIGLSGKLAGENKNRVKSIKLRNAISQGIVTELNLLHELSNETNSETITKYLGVEKYEPPIIETKTGRLVSLPEGQSIYDIEGADRNGNIIESHFFNELVVIREKLEGTNSSITINTNKKVFVNQKGYSIEELDGIENAYWKIYRETGLVNFIQSCFSCEQLEIYAELCGPKVHSENIYDLKENHLYIFDMKVNHEFLNDTELEDVFNKLLNSHPNLHIAPVIFKGLLKDFLEDKTIQEKSDGSSLVNPTKKREGIVVKLLNEKKIEGYGRSIIKQRGPIYLSNSDN